MSDTDHPVVSLTIDGEQVEARAGELLIKAAEDNGTYIPRFCWHPRMNPVGMCRMCLVENRDTPWQVDNRLLHAARQRRHGGPYRI